MASPGSQAKDRQANATRNSRTGAAGNANRDAKGGTARGIDLGALSNVGNPGPMGVTAANLEGPVTSYGAPIHTGTGPISRGIQVAQDPLHWQATVDRVKLYNDAATKWNASTGPSFGNLANHYAPLGLSMQPPDINRPSTFAGGDYHLGWNPGSLLGLAGATIPGAGMLTGALGQAAYTAAGLPNAILGGSGTPPGMPNWSKGQPTAALPGDTGAGSPAAIAAARPTIGQLAAPRTAQLPMPWLSALAQRPRLGQSMMGG